MVIGTFPSPSTSSPSTNHGEKATSGSVSTSAVAGDHGSSAAENRGVGVVVRVRPLSTQELANSTLGYCIKCFQDAVIIDGTNSSGGSVTAQRYGNATKLSKPRRFEADTVHHQHCTQKQVYEESCRQIVEALFDGINGAIIAYGATGSGKTHTMFGGNMSAPGIVYEAINDIFDVKTLLEEEEGKRVKVKCSFIEIYNENVFDLLSLPRKPNHGGAALSNPSASVADNAPFSASSNPTNASQPKTGPTEDGADRTGVWVNGRQSLPVLEVTATSGKAGEDKSNAEALHIPGLTYVYPESVEEFTQSIEKGRLNRFVASTSVNAQSSRSHAIITIEVQISSPGSSTGTVGRIRMCDLAGSERAASSTNSGIRRREGGSINRSLLELGTVVQGLLEQKRKPNQKTFISYRGSRLTRLLKDSLGGNCRTQMIFCLNPSTKQLEESVNTMLFAMKAKQVQVQTHRNELSLTSTAMAKNQELLIDELRQQVSYYQEEVRRLGITLEKENAAKWQTDSKGASNVRKNSVDAPLHVSMGSSSPWISAAASSPNGSVCTVTGPQYVEIARQRRREKKNFMEEVETEILYTPTTTENLSPASPFSGDGGTGEANGGESSPTKSPHLSWDADGESPSFNTGVQGGSSALRRRQKIDVMSELSPQFLSLQSTLTTLIVEKESQYWENRAAKERIVARDLQLRELNWKLARFLASNELGVRLRGVAPTTSGGTVPTPVGVAGMRNTIADVEAEQARECDVIKNMMVDLERTDRKMEFLQKEIPRDTKNQALVEVLFDNIKLRQSSTEAEHLAAEYHQECRQAKGHISEYEEALSVCVSALHSVIPHVPHNAKAMADAQLALFYANLPRAATEEMIKVFEASLKADSTPPLVPLGNTFHTGNVAEPEFPSHGSSSIRPPSALHTSKLRESLPLGVLDAHEQHLLPFPAPSGGRQYEDEPYRSTSYPYGRNEGTPRTRRAHSGSSPSLFADAGNHQEVRHRVVGAEVRGEDDEEEPSPLSYSPPQPHPFFLSDSRVSEQANRSRTQEAAVKEETEEMDEFKDMDTTISTLSSSNKSKSSVGSISENVSSASDQEKVEDSPRVDKESATVPVVSRLHTQSVKQRPLSSSATKTTPIPARLATQSTMKVVKKPPASGEKIVPQKLARFKSNVEQPSPVIAGPQSVSQKVTPGEKEKKKEDEGKGEQSCHGSETESGGSAAPPFQGKVEENSFTENSKKYSHNRNIPASESSGKKNPRTLTVEKLAPFTRYYSSTSHNSLASSTPAQTVSSPVSTLGNFPSEVASCVSQKSTSSQQQTDRFSASQGKDEGVSAGVSRRRSTDVSAGWRKGNAAATLAVESKHSDTQGVRPMANSAKEGGGKEMENAGQLTKSGIGSVTSWSSSPSNPITPTRLNKTGPRGAKRAATGESPAAPLQPPPQHVESDADRPGGHPSRVGSPSRPPLVKETDKSVLSTDGGGTVEGGGTRHFPSKEPVRVRIRKRGGDGGDPRKLGVVATPSFTPLVLSKALVGTDAKSNSHSPVSSPAKKPVMATPSVSSKGGGVSASTSSHGVATKTMNKKISPSPLPLSTDKWNKVASSANAESASKTVQSTLSKGQRAPKRSSGRSDTAEPHTATPHGRVRLSDRFLDDVEVSQSTLGTELDELSSYASCSSYSTAAA